MRTTLILVAIALFMVFPSASARHEQGCVTEQADPSTINHVDLTDVGGPLYYLEERGNPLNTQPPVPLSGFLLGEGTWFYEETNGVGGMQRGGFFDMANCFPPPPLPCLLIDTDPIQDENCGHGADRIIF